MFRERVHRLTVYTLFEDTSRENFKITLVNDGFDTFMLRLLLAQGHARLELVNRIRSRWGELTADNGLTLDKLALANFEALPDSL